MKEHRHFGVYGLIINDGKIVLIKKANGPYTGKLDLPGGSFEFGETPEETLKREILEEVGIEIKNYELYDANSVLVDWNWDGDLYKVHHVGFFYKVLNYTKKIKKEVYIDSHNDDSLGADFYEISELSRDNLSNIAILELEKLGYNID